MIDSSTLIIDSHIDQKKVVNFKIAWKKYSRNNVIVYLMCTSRIHSEEINVSQQLTVILLEADSETLARALPTLQITSYKLIVQYRVLTQYT